MRLKVNINKKDLLGSGLLCLLGLAAVLQVSAISVRPASVLGSSLFPVLLGSLLLFVGILWLFDSRLSPDDDEGVDIGVSKWRGCCGVVSGVFAFMLLGKYAGLVPAVSALVFITVLGDHRHTWRSAAIFSGSAALAVAVVLFVRPAVSLPLL